MDNNQQPTFHADGIGKIDHLKGKTISFGIKCDSGAVGTTGDGNVATTTWVASAIDGKEFDGYQASGIDAEEAARSLCSLMLAGGYCLKQCN